MATQTENVKGIIWDYGWTYFDLNRIEAWDSARCSCKTTSASPAVGIVNAFGFSIPSGSTIDGIEIGFIMSASFGTAIAYCDMVRISTNAGTSYTLSVSHGSAAQSATGTSDVENIFGGPTDKWYRTDLTAELLNSNDFHVYFRYYGSASNREARLDYMYVKIYYTETSGVQSSFLLFFNR